MKSFIKLSFVALTTANQQDFYGRQSVEQAAPRQSWTDFFMDQHEAVLEKMGFNHLKEQASTAWSLFSQDPETRRRNRIQHTERGAGRSGMGSEDQQKKRERMFAERETMDHYLNSNEYPTDIVTANKLYKYYHEKMADAPGVRRDDK